MTERNLLYYIIIIYEYYIKVFQNVHSSLQKHSEKTGSEPQKQHASRKTKVFRQETDETGISR